MTPLPKGKGGENLAKKKSKANRIKAETERLENQLEDGKETLGREGM